MGSDSESAKEIVKLFLCCLGIRLRLASDLGVFLGDAIFPIGGGIGGIAQAPKDLTGDWLIAAQTAILKMQYELPIARLVVGTLNSSDGEGFGIHAYKGKKSVL